MFFRRRPRRAYRLTYLLRPNNSRQRERRLKEFHASICINGGLRNVSLRWTPLSQRYYKRIYTHTHIHTYTYTHTHKVSWRTVANLAKNARNCWQKVSPNELNETISHLSVKGAWILQSFLSKWRTLGNYENAQVHSTLHWSFKATNRDGSLACGGATINRWMKACAIRSWNQLIRKAATRKRVRLCGWRVHGPHARNSAARRASRPGRSNANRSSRVESLPWWTSLNARRKRARKALPSKNATETWIARSGTRDRGSPWVTTLPPMVTSRWIMVLRLSPAIRIYVSLATRDFCLPRRLESLIFNLDIESTLPTFFSF